MYCTGNALLRRLVRIGVLDENRMKLDYVLGLKIEDFLERRLETQVCCDIPFFPLRYLTGIFFSQQVTSLILGIQIGFS